MTPGLGQLRLPLLLAALIAAGWLLHVPLLGGLGRLLVRDDPPAPADAVVVLCSDMEVYPRLLEAARIYASGRVPKVVINGNRKTDVLREIERRGFVPAAPWWEDFTRILEVLGVPRRDVIAVPAEEAYDTISEAQAVGEALLAMGIERVVVTTSKSHTRRSAHIWQNRFRGRLQVSTAAAAADPYDPRGWWRSPRQIRWVMAEVGAWAYYYWKALLL